MGIKLKYNALFTKYSTKVLGISFVLCFALLQVNCCACSKLCIRVLPPGRSREKPCISVVIWEGCCTLVLGSKLPLVRETWVWTQMDTLQNRGTQRQVWLICHSAHSVFQELLVNGNLLWNLFCYLHTYMLYRWSKVQICQWSYRNIWDEQGSLSPEATYRRFALWCKKYVYFCRYFTETSNFIYMSTQLQTRALIVLMRLNRTETSVMKRLFFLFYQKWFNFLKWLENWKEWRKELHITSRVMFVQLRNSGWCQNISVLLNITA